MNIQLQASLSDAAVPANQASQRQISVSLLAQASQSSPNAPLNICLILDHSGSMAGQPLETVKKAAQSLVDRMRPQDRLAIVIFDHTAKVLVPNQTVTNPAQIKAKIASVTAAGGTAIDLGMKLGLEQLAEGKKDAISQAFVLTDGENEHGNNEKCLTYAQLATSYNITFNALGFGEHWNQYTLEKIADAGAGLLSYIEYPEQAIAVFQALFDRIQAIGLTNAHLEINLGPGVKLADLKAVAQVAPETIELDQQINHLSPSQASIRIGDILVASPRTLLINVYLEPLPVGTHAIAQLQVKYDDPGLGTAGLVSEKIPLSVTAEAIYQAQPDLDVQKSILALGKYRQTQMAEKKLAAGDKAGAATLLQTAAKTALQMGDQNGATVLQKTATQLQAGEELSQAERKKTLLASKTVLGAPPTS